MVFVAGGKSWLDATQNQHCATAPRFGLILVRNRDDRSQLLEAGRLWQRLHLEAILQGVAMQPLKQMMEIYDRDCYTNYVSGMGFRLDRITGDDSWQAVLGFRCGYPSQPGTPSAGRSLDQVVLTTS